MPRALAFSIDISIRSLFYVVLGIGYAAWFGEAAIGLILLTTFLIEWFYPVAFELLWHGQTPGKASVGIRVVHQDGTPVRWPASLVRNLLLAADFLPLAYGFGIAALLSNAQNKRLGDLAAGTLVIHTVKPSPSTPIEAEITPQAPNIDLRPEEQRAIIAFAERAETFSNARAEELASLAEPLQADRNQLLGIGAYLLGRERNNP